MRPAHETKHEESVEFVVNKHTYTLKQSNTSGETGSTVWLSAQVLATYLASSSSSSSGSSRGPPRRGCVTCLELGAGTGLLSLVLRDMGYAVTATDHQAVLPLLQHNVTHNPPTPSPSASTLGGACGSLDVQEINWCNVDIQSRTTYDVICCADVVYVPTLLPALVRSIRRHSHSRTTVYLAQESRTPQLMSEFLSLCRREYRVMQVSPQEVAKVEAQLASTNQGEDCTRDAGEGEDEDWSGVEIYKLKLLKRLIIPP